MSVKIILFGLLIFILISCSIQSTETEQKIQLTKKEIIEVTNQKKTDSITNNILKTEVIPVNIITGRIVFMNTYCGGAWATNEIIEGYEQEHPLENSTVILKNSTDQEKYYKISTDKKGKFSIQIEPGIYNYFMTETFCQTMGADFNPSDNNQLRKKFGKIKVTVDQKNIYKIIFHFNNCGSGQRP